MSATMMMTKAPFHLKYKPFYVRDVSSDAAFLKLMRMLSEADSLNLLFIGDAHVGKTTLLYAIINEYYGLSPADRFPEDNVLFINNLKEQGIQYFRNEMKVFSQTHSSIFGKKKMIVIDDIDWINDQCQHVFRNYIDKYGHNIHFVCVCRNIQKVVESLQSRLHIIKIPKQLEGYVTEKANRIIAEEGILISEEALGFVLGRSGYSIRPIINFLEKLSIMDMDDDDVGGRRSVDLEHCKQLYVNLHVNDFDDFLHCLKVTKDLKRAIRILEKITDQGYSVIDIYEFFFTYLKQSEHATTAGPGLGLGEPEIYEIIKCLCHFIKQFHCINENAIGLVFFSKKVFDIFHAPGARAAAPFSL